MKKSKGVPTLYVYDHVSSRTGMGHYTSNDIVAFIAPSNDFMTSIFKAFEGDWGTSWGDFEEFERIDGDGGFDKWELRTTLELTPDELESLGMDLEDFEENVETPLEDLSIENFEIYGFDESKYNKLLFDAKSLIEPFKNLDNDQLDSLIKALESLKK
jgi:hypothetical protein